jgi:hypothetical protein
MIRTALPVFTAADATVARAGPMLQAGVAWWRPIDPLPKADLILGGNRATSRVEPCVTR